jgi:anti-anti-sigma regulatory factor
MQVVRQHRDRPAAEIVDALGRAACEHAGVERPHDDITVMLVKVLASLPHLSSARQDSDALQKAPADRQERGGNSVVTGSTPFVVEEFGAVTVVRLADANYFDRDNYTLVKQGLLELVEHRRPRILAIDLSRLVCLSTALVGTFLHVQKRVRVGGGVMNLFGLSPNALETLQHLKLAGRVFAVCPDEQTARTVV